MTSRNLIPSTSTPVRATAREWIIAKNLTLATGLPIPFSTSSRPLISLASKCCPFEMLLNTTLASGRFSARDLPSNAETPLNPNTARITANQALRAIDQFDKKARKRHLRESALLVFLIGLTISVLLIKFLSSESTSSLLTLVLCIESGFASALLPLLIHRYTCWFRRKIDVPKEKFLQLQASILAEREKAKWGHNVLRIFGEIDAVGHPTNQVKTDEALQLRYEELLDDYTKTSDTLAQTQQELAKARISFEKSSHTNGRKDMVLHTENGDIKIPLDFFVNTVIQSGEPGYHASVAMLILLLTAWSLRPPRRRRYPSSNYLRPHWRKRLHRTHLLPKPTSSS